VAGLRRRGEQRAGVRRVAQGGQALARPQGNTRGTEAAARWTGRGLAPAPAPAARRRLAPSSARQRAADLAARPAR
jgi:hypothetical protein